MKYAVLIGILLKLETESGVVSWDPPYGCF